MACRATEYATPRREQFPRSRTEQTSSPLISSTHVCSLAGCTPPLEPPSPQVLCALLQTQAPAISSTCGYNFNSGHDNGNVIGITNDRTGQTGRTQSFTYDQVNRILSGQSTATSGNTCWGETYSYDQWANLYTIGTVSGYTGCTQDNLNIGIGGVTTNNQLSSTGFSYDLAGNMTGDNTYTYGYNAESEIKSAAGVTYTYDGDGNRLEKTQSGGVYKIYWYGAGTEILDESDQNGSLSNEYVFFGGKRIAIRNVSSGTIDYYEEDMLGSSRTMVQAGGTSVCFDADFLPFGYEKDVTTTCTQNYKFEGKERDTETNNDDFGARYYTFRLGRWLSADWSSVPAPVPYANLTNPQTLNLYAMVSDNPESFADLDGHACSGLLRNSGSGFCTRATEYGQIDAKPGVQSQTRFFAAANAVSQALADVATPVSGFVVSGQTASFLEGLGQNLEKMNQAEASAIQNGSLSGPNLDQQLVHNEQSAVQNRLNNLQQSDSAAYSKTISEINRALNPGTAGQFFSTRFATDKAYAGVLAEVRKNLGRDIDFSKQSDREAIGNALIKHIRQTGGCDLNGKKQPGCS